MLNVVTQFALAIRIIILCLFIGCCIFYYLKTGATSEAGTVYPSSAHEFIPDF